MDPDPGYLCTKTKERTFIIERPCDEGCQEFAGGLTRGGYDRVEGLDGGDHGIIAVKQDLVIKPVDDGFYGIVVNQDAGLLIHLPLHPYLHLPAMAMQARTFPLIMEQPMAGVEMHLLEDPTDHDRLVGVNGI